MIIYETCVILSHNKYDLGMFFLDISQFCATSLIQLAIMLSDQLSILGKHFSKLRNITPGGYNVLSEFPFIFKWEENDCKPVQFEQDTFRSSGLS